MTMGGTGSDFIVSARLVCALCDCVGSQQGGGGGVVGKIDNCCMLSWKVGGTGGVICEDAMGAWVGVRV